MGLVKVMIMHLHTTVVNLILICMDSSILVRAQREMPSLCSQGAPSDPYHKKNSKLYDFVYPGSKLLSNVEEKQHRKAQVRIITRYQNSIKSMDIIPFHLFSLYLRSLPRNSIAQLKTATSDSRWNFRNKVMFLFHNLLIIYEVYHFSDSFLNCLFARHIYICPTLPRFIC